MNFLKDICTLADGESACLAGIASLIGIAVSLLIMMYIFFLIQPAGIKDILEALKTFVETICGITVTGAGGKIATNKAESNG